MLHLTHLTPSFMEGEEMAQTSYTILTAAVRENPRNDKQGSSADVSCVQYLDTRLGLILCTSSIGSLAFWLAPEMMAGHRWHWRLSWMP